MSGDLLAVTVWTAFLLGVVSAMTLVTLSNREWRWAVWFGLCVVSQAVMLTLFLTGAVT